MPSLRSPEFVLAGTVLLMAALSGCSRGLEIDVPPAFHGHVTVLCDTLERDAKPIHVADDGTAAKATCPKSEEALTVVHGKEPVRPINQHWSTTGDGIVLSIEFDIP